MIASFLFKVSMSMLIVGLPLVLVGFAIHFGKRPKLGEIIFGIGAGLMIAGCTISIVYLLAILWGA